MVRKMQAMKMRGQPPIPGLHTFRITSDGVQVFPRIIVRAEAKSRQAVIGAKRKPRERLSLGVSDWTNSRWWHSGRLLGAARRPIWLGKSVLATEFISEGVCHDEPGIIAVFEKRPTEYPQDCPSGRRFSGSSANAKWASFTRARWIYPSMKCSMKLLKPFTVSKRVGW